MESTASLTMPFLALVEVLSKLYDSMHEKSGLTRLRWAILYLAEMRGPLTMSELTRQLDIAKSNVTYHVDWLESNGYLKREPSAEDRRVTYLRVTPEGAAIVQLVPDEIARRLAHMAQQVSPEELRLMESGLKLLVAHSNLLLEEAPGKRQKLID